MNANVGYAVFFFSPMNIIPIGIAGLLLFRWIGFNAMLALGVMLAVVATVSIITVSSRVRRVRAPL